MELYKKHRPKSLDRIIGNRQTVASLKKMLTTSSLPHTILFHGPAGCGKTTMARILTKELGCNKHDFKEVNASSFRGIDSIREIGRIMNLAPIGTCRIWLMDECHKWTNDAQNAALKMLEDTPGHVYFFLCTTDPQRLIPALRSRCCPMPVELLRHAELNILLKRTIRREKIELSGDVMDELISAAQGSARNLLVLLDKTKNLDPEEQIKAIQQRLEEESGAIELCRALIQRAEWKQITSILKSLKVDPETTRWSVLGYARAVLLKTKNAQAYIIIDCFKDPFYTSTGAGLIAACYEAISEG